MDLPIGAIIAWYGKDSLPIGFVLCDGNNGTLDLSKHTLMSSTDSGYRDLEFGDISVNGIAGVNRFVFIMKV